MEHGDVVELTHERVGVGRTTPSSDSVQLSSTSASVLTSQDSSVEATVECVPRAAHTGTSSTAVHPTSSVCSLATDTTHHTTRISLRSTVSHRAIVTDDQVHPSDVLGSIGAAMGTLAVSTSPLSYQADYGDGSGEAGSSVSSSLPRDRPGDGCREDSPQPSVVVRANTGALGRSIHTAAASTADAAATTAGAAPCHSWHGSPHLPSLPTVDDALHAERGASSPVRSSSGTPHSASHPSVALRLVEPSRLCLLYTSPSPRD